MLFTAAVQCAALSQHVFAQGVYSVNTDTGSLTLDGLAVGNINGVPVADNGTAGGIRTLHVRGDLVLLLSQRVEVSGAMPLRLMVARNVLISPYVTMKVSANGSTPGPGGGVGGIAPTAVAIGGNGGGGGGTLGSPAPGQNGFDGAGNAGGGGGEGGGAATDGGNGAFGNGIGAGPGVGRGSRLAGGNGQNGNSGFGGLGGGRDFANANPIGFAGTGGVGAGITFAPQTPTGGGAGGLGGAGPGGNGGDGGSGEPGVQGTDGANGHDGGTGGPGLNTNQLALSGGTGGGSGGCGGGGAGAAGGSEGGAGGGGGAGVPVGISPSIVPGGGGGGGGGAGSGGNGGHGGSGGVGGAGGPGAGCVQILAFGRIDVEIESRTEAIGGDSSAGQPGSGGDQGTLGGEGSVGGQGGTTETTGGRGGDGAKGGRGGNGGTGGFGGPGGGGAGGAIALVGARIGVAGDIITSGGAPNGGKGRLLLGQNESSNPVSAFAHLTDIGMQVEMGASTIRSVNLYTGIVSPLFAPSHATIVGLESGPAPYGFMPSSVLSTPEIAAAVNNAPVGAVVAFVRSDRGVAPFEADWQVRFSSTILTKFDVLHIVNVSGATITGLRINGQQLREFPVLERSQFGGDDTPNVIDQLAPGQAYAIFFPEATTSFNADVQSVVPGVVNRSFAVANGSADYFLRPCAFTISQQPMSMLTCLETGASFSVQATGPGPFAYQWRHNSTPIDATSSGNPSAATSTLSLASVQPDDVGSYDCIITNSCGSGTSHAATLTVLDRLSLECCPCPADFDGSGGTPDSTDIAAFFTAWLLGDPAADADCSGGTPDSTDISAFFTAWLAGGC